MLSILIKRKTFALGLFILLFICLASASTYWIFVFWIDTSIIKILVSLYLQRIIFKLLPHKLHTVFKLGKNKYRNNITTD